jgi:molybdate transport system substrate-binding protein
MTFAKLRLFPLMLAALCTIGAAPPTRGPLVLAASSLQESMTAAADAWARAGHPRPVVSFAASSALARQAMAGARADLFVSADEEWMDALAAKGLLRPGTRTDFVGNRLVLVAPLSAARGSVQLGRGGTLGRVLGDGRLAMADPAAVPAGRYGQAALERLGDWPAVGARIARAENVRAALALVERGAAPLGVVYATDARASTRVRVVAVFPSASHPPIRYPLAVLKASSHRDAAGFRAFLLSPRGKAIFRRFGFVAP